MAKLIYVDDPRRSTGTSRTRRCTFDWAAPDEEVHAFVNDLERPVGDIPLTGGGCTQTMVFGESLPDLDRPTRPRAGVRRDLAGSRAKIVYSRTMPTASSARTRIERQFDPEAVRQLKERVDRDLTIGGPGLAARPIEAGLVDEDHLLLVPVVVGGGKRVFPGGDIRVDLELLDERRFRNGTVYLHHRARRAPP